jgi:hypothetical protein
METIDMEKQVTAGNSGFQPFSALSGNSQRLSGNGSTPLWIRATSFSQFRGDGVYTFSTTMFIPSGSGVATIQFETFTNPVTSLSAFLHLDFTPHNQVRIDDGASFGTFPRDKPFIVQVTLNINSTSSTAQIVLSGDGASGQSNYTILSPFQLQSRQFGAIRVWQGFPHTGAFNATNIVVTQDTE